MERYQIGDFGYCKLLGHNFGLLRTFEDNTVVSVDCGAYGCDHELCGHADVCEVYQRAPVGYHFIFRPEKEIPEN